MGEADHGALLPRPVDDRVGVLVIDDLGVLEAEDDEVPADRLLVEGHALRIEVPFGIPVHQAVGLSDQRKVDSGLANLAVADVAEHSDDVEVVGPHHLADFVRREHAVGVRPRAEDPAMRVGIPGKPGGRLRPVGAQSGGAYRQGKSNLPVRGHSGLQASETNVYQTGGEKGGSLLRCSSESEVGGEPAFKINRTLARGRAIADRFQGSRHGADSVRKLRRDIAVFAGVLGQIE